MLNALTETEIGLISKYCDLSPGSEAPMALWIIGRPAAGKTTTAMLLRDALRQSGCRVELIDGDIARSVLDGSMGYSANDRLMVFEKYVHINQILQRRGIIPITATIAGFRQFRTIIRNNMENPKLIYLDCPFKEAARRDQKGNYAKAMAGDLKNFFGIDIPYEEPVNCEMKIDSVRFKPAEIVAGIVKHLHQAGLCAISEWIGFGGSSW